MLVIIKISIIVTVNFFKVTDSFQRNHNLSYRHARHVYIYIDLSIHVYSYIYTCKYPNVCIYIFIHM